MERTTRRSRKREAILNLIRGTDTHPGASWVYDRLKPDFPDLSFGTVYRNIAQFRESGDLVLVATVNGQERYDADTGAHAHFICRCCGCVQDAGETSDTLFIQAIQTALLATGAQVDRINLSFGGLCAQCLSSNDSAPKN